jgi:hypothetical protein
MDRRIVECFTDEWWGARCRAFAADHLPSFLARLCESSGHGLRGRTEVEWSEYGQRSFPELWYVQDLQGALLTMMKRQAEQTLPRIVPTAVVREVWKAADYALYARGLVTVEGDSRFGKTEALRTYCDAYPGRLRYFAVPEPGRLHKLHVAVADAFGLPYSAKASDATLENAVNYILQFGRIGVAGDEGHFLPPSRGREPRRLDWFKTHIVDKKTPCVLSYTPQFEKEMRRFVKESNYTEAQWRGRVKMAYTVPAELDNDDLLAVARHHLPDCASTRLLLRVAGRAARSPHFLAAMETVAMRARWHAVLAGRESPAVADVETAMNDCLPSALAPVTPLAGGHSAPASRPSRKRPASQAHARETEIALTCNRLARLTEAAPAG